MEQTDFDVHECTAECDVPSPKYAPKAQDNVTRAVKHLASMFPKVERNLWVVHGINAPMAEEAYDHMSSMEAYAFQAALSLYNNGIDISLNRALNFDDKNYVKFIQALMIAGGLKKVEVDD